MFADGIEATIIGRVHKSVNCIFNLRQSQIKGSGRHRQLKVFGKVQGAFYSALINKINHCVCEYQ